MGQITPTTEYEQWANIREKKCNLGKTHLLLQRLLQSIFFKNFYSSGAAPKEPEDGWSMHMGRTKNIDFTFEVIVQPLI